MWFKNILFLFLLIYCFAAPTRKRVEVQLLQNDVLLNDTGFVSGYGDSYDAFNNNTSDENFNVDGSDKNLSFGISDDSDNFTQLRSGFSFDIGLSVEASRIGEHNNAKELFFECAGGEKECQPKKRPLPLLSPHANDEKKVKKTEEINQDNNEEVSPLLSPGILQPPEANECYFALVRKTQQESMSRSKQAEVSTDCEGSNLISFKKLIEEEIDLFGATNVAQVILERGGGEFNLDFENVDVKNEIGGRKLCMKHYDELYLKWDTRNYHHVLKSERGGQKKAVCSMDSRYHPHQAIPFFNKNFVKVTSHQASAFLEKTGMLIHIGIPVCPLHGKALEKISAENTVEGDGYSIVPSHADFGYSPSINVPVDEEPCNISGDETQPLKCGKGTYISSSSSSSSSQGSSKDPSFKPRVPPLPLSTPNIEVTKEIQDAFYTFAQATGAERYKLLVDFDKLQRRTKQKKVCLYRSFMDTIATIMAGDKKTMLLTMANSKNGGYDWQNNPDKQMEKALGYVREQYNVASSRDLRLNVIAQVAHIYPLTAIQKAVPGLTPRFYTAARKKAKQRLVCPDKPRVKRKTKRYNEGAATYFIGYITSPPISTMLPSAHIKVRTPDGKKTTIPAVMRRFHDGEIINMFEKHCEEDEYAECGLSQYVMRSILKVCSAKKQKSLQCVDYFLAFGQEAFLKIRQAVTKIYEKDHIDQRWHDGLLFGLQESENYLKTDYYTQMKLFSRIGDLCMVYALSDPDIKEFQAKDCLRNKAEPHEHDLQTDRIRLFDRTIIDIRDILGQLISETYDSRERESLSEIRDDVFKYEKDIIEWKKHIVRAKYSNHQRQEILAKLKEGEALVTVDYATRYIPLKHIEMQSDFFGKKGLSWHISHIITKVRGEFVQHTITHLMDEEDQNGQAVLAILSDVLARLKEVDIHTVTIRSDNAGYYKNAQVLVSLPVIAKEIGITLSRYSFSESQSGKAEADREAGRMKRRMHYALNHGNDITNGDQMLAAITSGTVPLSGLTVVLAKLNYVAVKKKATIPLISSLYDFVYSDDTIRYWKHFGIGNGKLIKQSSFERSVIRPTLTITKEWDHPPSDLSYSFWMATKQEEEERIPPTTLPLANVDVDTEIDPEVPSGYNPSKLLNCPVANCEAQFIKPQNLDNHLILGNHKLAIEKYTLQEFAFKLYQNHLEGYVESRSSLLRQRNLEAGESSSDDQPEMGWALKTTKKGARYTSDMRLFLDVEFSKYYKKQKKPDVKEVENTMAMARTNDGKRRFTAEQRLNSRQIAAYYRRKAEKLREQIENELVLSEEEQEAVSDNIIREMNDETGELEIEYEDDPMFIIDEEEIMGCVKNQFGNHDNESEEDDPELDTLYEEEAELAAIFEQRHQCT